MGFRKNIGNRALNTIGAATRRPLGTVGNKITDVAKTAIYGVLDSIEGSGKTGSSIKEAVNKAFTEGKWYQKLRKAPASLAATPFMLVEGIGETLRYTGYNLLRNVRDTFANPWLNIGQAFKMVGSKKDLTQFKFNMVNVTPEVNPKNLLAGLFKPKPAPIPVPTP